MKNMIWAYLIHLGTNMWHEASGSDRTSPIKYDDPPVFRDEILCDKEVWRKIVDFLPGQGINALVIDIGDAIKYESCPEISVKGAWTKDELRKELARIRSLGLEPVPKLNFSACHDAWMKEYSRALSTPRYYEVVRALIEEVSDLFDKPGLFHIGMDEENYDNQVNNDIIVIRNKELWWHDLCFICECAEKCGARPWMWSDAYWANPAEFASRMPREVLQSNWYYSKIKPKENGRYKQKAYQTYVELDRLGYDQIPTSSTWSFYGNSEQTVRLTIEENFDRERLLGFMTAPWLFTTENNYYALLNDAWRLGRAKKIYLESR